MSTPSSRMEPNAQVRLEASEWFVTFRFDDADAQARVRFGEWLRRSPEHIQAYLEIAGVWASIPREDPAGRIDVAALIARARAADSNVVPLEGAAASHRAERGKSQRLLLAASIVLACLLTAGAIWLGLNRGQAYATQIGEQRSITLADGSTVELNARTKIRVRFTSTERRIELLAGQALFSVAHNATRPFRVRAG